MKNSFKKSTLLVSLFAAMSFPSPVLAKTWNEPIATNVNAVNYRGLTALMGAAEGGSFEDVKALVDAGADVHAVDNNGQTALGHAKENEHPGIRNTLEQLTILSGIAENT